MSRVVRKSRESSAILPYGASTYSKSAVAYGPDFPVRATHGDGWRIFVDGKDLCDCVMGLGSVILGHRHPGVDDAIRKQLSLGTTLSLGTGIEIEAAERVLRHFPSGYSLQWGVNGTDATTGALRLARLVTGRSKVIMAADGYHGFADWSLADSPRGSGIPYEYDRVIRIRDLNELRDLDEPEVSIAAVIVEPDSYLDWLSPLRHWCDKHGALLIFDEVMTWGRYPGFHAANYFKVEPDLTCIGKSLANGMPVSAIVGKRNILARFAPSSQANAFFSMTWAGHPLSMAAVIATCNAMESAARTDWLWNNSNRLHSDISTLLNTHRCELIKVGLPPWNRITSEHSGIMTVFRKLMLDNGVLIYSAHNLSLSHDRPAMDRLLNALSITIRDLPNTTELPAFSLNADAGVMRR